jgi:hypothetical protein
MRSIHHIQKPGRQSSVNHTAFTIKPSKATIIERRLSISVGSRTGTTDLVLPPEVLPVKLVLEASGGAFGMCGGVGGASSLRVHVQPGRQYACVVVGVAALACRAVEGLGKNRAVNGRA